MKSFILKPFDDGKYVSEEDALKWVESLPKPEEQREEETNKPEKETFQEDNPAADLEGRLIELNPADKGSYKTQDGWIAYFNDKNKIMTSMPDLYMAGKSNNQNLLESLRKDFQDRWIVTSTRIKYENNTNARIIHNYGSRLIAPIEHKIVIPEYEPESLANVLCTKEGLRYLQALFGTKDNASQIKETLQKLSGYQADKTKLWTPNQYNRKRCPVRAACLYYDVGEFRVDGNDDLSNYGRSRGVRRAKNFHRK